MAEQSADNMSNVNRNLTLEVKRRIRLDGVELENYRARKRAEEREATRLRFALFILCYIVNETIFELSLMIA